MRHFSQHSYLRILGSGCAIFVLLASVFVTAHFSQARATSSLPIVNNPVIFLHGINDDCHAWRNAMLVLGGSAKVSFTGPRIKLGYSIDDLKSGSNCTANLSESGSSWRNSCNGYLDRTAQAEIGTNNESIRHLACEFAWYIYFKYSNRQVSVDVVAHSMGGLIARYAIYAVQNRSNNKIFKHFFPPQLDIANVVDLDTPNHGIPFDESAQYILCGSVDWRTGNVNTCRQARQMAPNSDFISELYKLAQDPQGSGQGGTMWTLLGSTPTDVSVGGLPYGLACLDSLQYGPPLFPESSLNMYGNHILQVVYEQPYYCHNGPYSMQEYSAIPNQPAVVQLCGGCTIGAPYWKLWHKDYVFPDPLYEMPRVLSAQASSPTPTPSPTLSPTSSPTPGTVNPYFNGVTAISANDVWAVGEYYTNGGDQTLIEQWNGTSWNILPGA